MTTPDPREFEAALDGFPVVADAENVAARETLEVIASRFAEEVRRGLRPSIGEYAHRHRHLADEIREFLPMVEALERWKYDKEAECVRQNLPDALPFRQLGDYTLVREVGRGGTGVVFEAVDAKTGKRVAVKLLPWRYLSDLPRRKERFRREAATIAGLRHWNIVPVFGFGEHEGYCFYVMQLVTGVSLDAVIRRLRNPAAFGAGLSGAGDPLRGGAGVPAGSAVTAFRALRRDSWTAFAHLAAQVAFALSYAHGQGVQHNDIKPGNLILDETGRVVVTDFGVGRPPEPGAPEMDEAPVGTIRYMAPERFEGICDARSDVYSLGVTLCELLTLSPLFEGPDRGAVIDLVKTATFRRPRQINPQVPLPLEAIALRAMRLDPEDRYLTAQAMALDLMRFVNGQPIEAPTPSFLQRARRWWRSTPAP